MGEAIPAILRAAPELRIRFIGPSWPFSGGDMRAHLERRLARHLSSIEFTGAITPAELPARLADVDAVVLPSRWENFPYACWESLASARVVIGSSAGGMAEVIESGVSGLLVPPRDPAAIREAVLSLVREPDRVRSLALAGRARVLSHLDPARVLPLHLAAYERALARAAARRAVSCNSAS
jgi:glycogen synthase